MSDFENDPAADFLAREQSELGELGDDLGFSSGQNFGSEINNEFEEQDEPNSDNEAKGEVVYDEYEESAPVDEDAMNTNGPSDNFGAIRTADTQRAEPEKIRLWRIEFEERMKRKDADELVKISEWQEAAAKELQDWHRRNLDQQEKTGKLNKEQEAIYIKERDDTDPGLEWERVARLCEFNPKNCKQQRDVSRMRSILLQLKTTPLARS